MLIKLFVETSKSYGTWILREHHMDTLQCANRGRKPKDFNFGVLGSGQIIYEESLITFRHCMLLIFNDSGVNWSAINWEPCTSSWQPIQTIYRISIKIYPTTPNIRSESFLCLRIGSGVKVGVRKRPRVLPRRSIYVTILSIRSPRYLWPSVLSVEIYLMRVGLN